jgi:polysaccharide deacetylase 2 family uncharacterized protein YibQ
MVFWGIIIAVVAIGLLLWGPFHKAKKATVSKPPVTTGKQREITAVVAIVIDDLGQDMKPAQELLDLPDHITLAVMPRLPYSKKIAEAARRSGREVLVHIPMEAKVRTEKHSTPGMLRSDMTPMEFISAVKEDLDSVPGAVGANNHEGSALTENREAMTFLMSELKPRGLFFLDSMTSPKSAAFTVAREFGLRSARRDVFLDNDGNNPAAIRKQLDELARTAKQNGRAIGIGHPHPATIAELRKWLGRIEEQGIEVVPVSMLVK